MFTTLYRSILIIISMLLLGLSLTIQVYAQPQENELTRGLRRRASQNTDALAITIFTATPTSGQCTQWVKVDPSQSLRFKSGDCIRLTYKTNVDAYVYFLNVDKTGTRVVEPELSELVRTQGKVRAFEEKTSEFELDDVSGREELIVVMAANPIPKMNEAVQRPDLMLDTQVTSLPIGNTETTAFSGNETERTRGLKKILKKVGIIVGGVALNVLEQWTGIQIPIDLASIGGSRGEQAVPVQPRSADLQPSNGNVVATPQTTSAISSKKLLSGQLIVMRVSFDHVGR